MGIWILIVVLHGWGAGLGSQGNAVTAAEFSSRERCLFAKAELDRVETGRGQKTFCVQK